MTIFWRLVLAHFISDFTLQSNRVASWKRQSRWGMAVHVFTHPVVTCLLLWPHLSEPWLQTPWGALPGWACVAGITLSHWIQDEWRVWMIRTGWPDTTGLLLWDQFVHLSIIFAVAPRRPDLPVEGWVGLLLCAVLLAHVVSVLVFFMENDQGVKSQVLKPGQKYLYMAERFAGAGLLLLPGAWGLGGAAWIAWRVWAAWREPARFTRVHMVVGFFSALVLGLAGRTFLR